MAEPSSPGVRFSEAIEFLRRQLNLSSAEWRAVWEAAGLAAAVASDDVAAAVLRDLVRAVETSLSEGTTLAAFRSAYDRIVAEAGWTPAGTPGWHAQLVYRLQTGSAYAAGRWEQAQQLAASHQGKPYYFRYVTIGDHRVRPEHRAWHGVILPIGHAFWRTHLPPNGFNCRCHVQVVTDRDLRRYGWTVTGDGDARLRVPPDRGFAGSVALTRQSS